MIHLSMRRSFLFKIHVRYARVVNDLFIEALFYVPAFRGRGESWRKKMSRREDILAVTDGLKHKIDRYEKYIIELEVENQFLLDRLFRIKKEIGNRPFEGQRATLELMLYIKRAKEIIRERIQECEEQLLNFDEELGSVSRTGEPA